MSENHGERMKKSMPEQGDLLLYTTFLNDEKLASKRDPHDWFFLVMDEPRADGVAAILTIDDDIADCIMELYVDTDEWVNFGNVGVFNEVIKWKRN
jgi:hypothetical protein